MPCLRPGAPEKADHPPPSSLKCPDPATARKSWPFTPLAKPEPPPVKNEAGLLSPLDRFVRAGLESRQLSPAPPADRRTLIRRTTMAVLGLPPRLDDVEAFAADADPAAFEKLVTSLLASPQSAERWGTTWLNAVTYADTLPTAGSGHALQEMATAWRYRDVTLGAATEEMPLSDFLRLNLAGDLPTQRKSSAPIRALSATQVFLLGPPGDWRRQTKDPRLMLLDQADGEVRLLGSAFLGLDFSCARCHDHPSAPISQADYAGLAGVFLSSRNLDALHPPAAPALARTAVLSRHELAAEAPAWKELESAEAAHDKYWRGAREHLAELFIPQTPDYVRAAWEVHRARWRDVDAVAHRHGLVSPILRNWMDALGLTGFERLSLARPVYAREKSLSAWLTRDGQAGVVANRGAGPVVPLGSSGPAAQSFPPHRLTVIPGSGPGVTVAWRAPADMTAEIEISLSDVELGRAPAAWWSLSLRHGSDRELLVNGEAPPPDGSLEIKDAALASLAVRAGDFLELTLKSGSVRARACAVDFSVKNAAAAKSRWSLKRDVVSDLLARGLGNPHAAEGSRGEIWYFYRPEPVPIVPTTDPLWKRWYEAGKQASLKPVAAVAADYGKLDPALLVKPMTDFSTPGDVTATRDEIEQLHLLEKRLAKALAGAPADRIVHALTEGGVPGGPFEGFGDAPLQQAANSDATGPRIPRRLPDVLGGTRLGSAEASGREDLANYIAGPENPLTARVLANRVWISLFGTSLVPDPSNLAASPGPHTALLDWLAATLVESGWSLKKLQRAILLSATWQQGSGPADGSLAVWPARPLDPGEFRDALLFASGLLDPRLNGTPQHEAKPRRRSIYLQRERGTPTPPLVQDELIEDATQALLTLSLKKAATPSDRDRLDWLHRTLHSQPLTDPDWLAAQPRLKNPATAWPALIKDLIAHPAFRDWR